MPTRRSPTNITRRVGAASVIPVVSPNVSALDGLVNAWCATTVVRGAPALINIVLTERDRDGELGLSGMAYEFIGGVLHNAEGPCALTNPTVNSFKRINGAPTLSGATWSLNTISYRGNSWTHMIRIPDVDRFDLCLPDGATNPYPLPATVIDRYGSKSRAGTQVAATLYTLVETAKQRHVAPTRYLLEAVRTADRGEVLMPWQLTAGEPDPAP